MLFTAATAVEPGDCCAAKVSMVVGTSVIGKYRTAMRKRNLEEHMIKALRINGFYCRIDMPSA